MSDVTIVSTTADVTVLSTEREVTFVQVGVQGPAGPSAHGELSGLDDDDHPQYHNNARGDARYTPLAHASDTDNPHEVTAAQVGADASGTAATAVSAHAGGTGVHAISGVTGLQTALDGKSPTSHDHSSGNGAQVAYASLSGTPTLGTAAALDVGTTANKVVQLDGAAKLPAIDGSQLTHLPAVGGITIHGDLSALESDDHPQYHNDTRGDLRYSVLAHNHTGTYETAGSVATHAALTTVHGISAWGATLVDDADANTARSTLGLGTAATTASTAYATSTQGANADSHASNTSNPHAVSKTQVGLGSVDNTSDASKPVSTAQQTALNLKANLASPTFTGTVVGVTAAMVGAPSGSGTSTGENTGNETTTTVGALINGATAKATPVDADHIGLMDSAASNILKKLSWANLKTTLLGGSPITDFFKHGSVVMNANVFGGRKLFINSINNALFRAEARWVVTGNLFLTADDSLVGAISPTELAKLFDGNYETFLTVPVGNYAVINISFSTEPAGLYPGYPYGTFYLSYYHNGYPSGTRTSTVSVYSTYAPHGVGWHSADFGAFFSGTNQKIDSAYLIKYAITQVELKIYAPDSGIATWLSQLDLDLDRPSINEMPVVDKFRTNKLYAKLSTETLTPRVAGTYDLGESGTPYRRLFLRHTTEQLRAEYDAANYLGSTTNSAGVTTFNLVGTAPAAKWTVSDATTNAIYPLTTFSKNCTGAGAAGLGLSITLAAKSSTTVDMPQVTITSSWIVPTHAIRTSRGTLNATDYNGTRESVKWEADGTVARLGFFGATAIVKPTALTTQLTTITYTDPGTPDYAVSDVTQTTPFGFTTADEARTVLSVIKNLQDRVGQLETKLQALGLLT